MWTTLTVKRGSSPSAPGRGVIVKRGAYNFAAVAHDEEAIRKIESATSSALVALAEWERAPTAVRPADAARTSLDASGASAPVGCESDAFC